MTEDAFAILMAAFFTAGCVFIHEAREHAKAMTPHLALVAACLGLFVALIAMAETPRAHDRSPVERATTEQTRSVTPLDPPMP